MSDKSWKSVGYCSKAICLFVFEKLTTDYSSCMWFWALPDWNIKILLCWVRIGTMWAARSSLRFHLLIRFTRMMTRKALERALMTSHTLTLPPSNNWISITFSSLISNWQVSKQLFDHPMKIDWNDWTVLGYIVASTLSMCCCPLEPHTTMLFSEKIVESIFCQASPHYLLAEFKVLC